MGNRVTYKYGEDGKLVRGGKFERMLADGQEPDYMIAVGDMYLERVMRKFPEEVDEFGRGDRAKKVEELGDMLEVVELLAHLSGITMFEVAQAQEVKRREAGDFLDGIVVFAVTVNEGDEWDRYYGERPDVFIRVEPPHEP